MLKTYHGSCHCGAVKFEVDADISRGTEKCNCTICQKMRLWSFKVKPEAIRILQGDDAMTDYQYGSGVAHHTFCRNCGIRPFEWVDLPPPRSKYYNVSVVCLEDLDINDLIAAPVKYEDGLHDEWDKAPVEIRWL